MQAHKFIALLIATFTLAATALADNLPFDAPTFQISVKREEVRRQLAPLRVFVTLNKVKFTFLTPDGFQVRDDLAQQRVVITSPDQSCTLIVRFGASTLENPLDTSACRDLVLSRYPSAKMMEEFLGNAAGRKGPGFDLQWNSGGTLQSSRVAFIPSPVSIVEFNASGSSEVQNSFRTVTESFQVSDADGRLAIVTASDQM